MNEDDLRLLDKDDPLAALRDLFDLPEGKVYLDGNSLGALPRGVAERIDRVIRREWGEDLIGSWNRHDWISLPARVGDRIGRLIGAAPGQVVCTDSISVNLFKLLSAALSLQAGRTVILSQRDNFPTDLYMAEGLRDLLGTERCALKSVAADQLIPSLDEGVAVLMLTQVNFRDGSLHDMHALTQKAHECGALVLWDLAHSAGVIPLSLDDWGVDMAVGCGYKYLNGGPGAPAFLYLSHKHQASAAQPLSGWMGHAKPFDFTPEYAPAEGIHRFLAGTPGILGMVALDTALNVFDGTSMSRIRHKSQLLTQAFIDIVSALEVPGVKLISPTDPDRRGSQVSVSHAHGFAVAQALIDHGVIVDFRAPDIIRFGFSPLYNRFTDAGLAAGAMARIIKQKRYLDPAYSDRQAVT